MIKERHYENNFSGTISNLQIQQNTVNSSQTQTNDNTFSYDEALKIIQQIENEIPNFQLPTKTEQEFEILIKELFLNINEKREETLIKKSFSVLKNILQQTSTNLASTGVIQLIDSFLKQL